MLTGKQKRFLRAIGTELDPIVQVGKAGIAENVILQAKEALKAREIIKIRVLPNSDYVVKDAAQEIADKTNSELVQVIGRNFLLYKKSTKKDIIQLPN